PAGTYDDTHQFIFFAVLEGCYADGITNEDLDLIIPESENGLRQMITNFVYMCPLCEPAFDAFNFYAGRPHMSQPAKKTNYTTFGQGLDREVKEQLEKPGKPCRDAIMGLIKKWVDARIAKLRLNEEEEAVLREHLAARRKKGEEFLKAFQEGKNGDKLAAAYAGWKECPICSGSSPTMGGSSN
ncbi:MAG: hypothetical protein AAF585_13275, partial [Verrucomicrobiota bacterium]